MSRAAGECPVAFFVFVARWNADRTREEPGIARPKVDKTRINDMIRAAQIRVVDENGEQLGIMRPEDALREAESRGLDLVEVAPNGDPPVCRLIDYGKFRFQQSKRQKEAKKHQHTVSLKEIKYRPKISNHDYDFKTNHVREFLQQGNMVKLTIMFRGREMAHPEFGRELLARVVDDVSDDVHDPPEVRRTRMEGRNMSIVLSPTKRKT